MMAAENAAQNPFAELWRMGYRRLVPIVPPDAELSPKSTLSRNPACRGKAVGVRNAEGLWRSYDWVKYETQEADLETWFAMGAGVGIKTGKQADGTFLIGVDADTLDDKLAAVVSGQIRQKFGIVPTRIGRPPKALYLIRVASELRYTRIEFGPEPERVELLAEGRQFVAYGIHPVTMQRYRWAQPLVPFEDLPVQPVESLT